MCELRTRTPYDSLSGHPFFTLSGTWSPVLAPMALIASHSSPVARRVSSFLPCSLIPSCTVLSVHFVDASLSLCRSVCAFHVVVLARANAATRIIRSNEHLYNGPGACCIKCYGLICSQESYKFGECYTFSTLKSVTFSKFVGFLATNQFITFYTTGPWLLNLMPN